MKTNRTPLAALVVVVALSLVNTSCENSVNLRDSIEDQVMTAYNRYLVVNGIYCPVVNGTISPTDSIEISFDRAIDMNTVNPDTILIREEGGAKIAYPMSGVMYLPSSNTVRVRVKPFLSVNADISVTVDGVMGTDGSKLRQSGSQSFRTRGVFAGSVTEYPSYTQGSIDYTIAVNGYLRYFKYQISTDGTHWFPTDADLIALPEMDCTTLDYEDGMRVFSVNGYNMPGTHGCPEGDVSLQFRFWGNAQTSGDFVKGSEDTVTIVYDKTPPAAPSQPDLAPACDTGKSNIDDITKQTSALTFTGTAEPYSTVMVAIGAANYAVDADANGVYSATANCAPGTHQLRAFATDRAGNAGPYSSTGTLTIDTTAPVAPSVPDLAAADDSGISNTDNITNVANMVSISGTTEAGSTVAVDWNGTTLQPTISGTTWALERKTVGAGTSLIKAQATDVAGNVSPFSSTLTLVVDTSCATPGIPDLDANDDTGEEYVAPDLLPLNYDNITRLTTGLTFYVSAELNSTVHLTVGTLSMTGSSGIYGAIIDNVARGNGTHAVTAYAVDQAGNVSPTTASWNLVVDTVLPVATMSSSSAATDRTPTWTWTCSEPAGFYECALDDEFLGGENLAPSITSWTISPDRPDGDVTAYVKARDLAGNISAEASYTVTVNGVPNPPSFTAGSTVSPTVDYTPTWTWASGGFGSGNFRYKLDNSLFWSTTTATTYSPSSALSMGTHTFSIQERDVDNEWSTIASKGIVVSAFLPYHQETGIGTGSRTFEWNNDNSAYNDCTVIIYRRVLGTTSFSNLIGVAWTSGERSDLTTLLVNTTYEWYMRVMSGKMEVARFPADANEYFQFRTALRR